MLCEGIRYAEFEIGRAMQIYDCTKLLSSHAVHDIAITEWRLEIIEAKLNALWR